MTALLALMAQAAAIEPPPPPASWPALSPLPYRAPPAITPAITRYVRGEVEAGRCAAAARTGAGITVRVDLAVLVGDQVRRVTPIAIACPTVEQYAAGLVTGWARDNLVTPGGGAVGWYRTTLLFSWTP